MDDEQSGSADTFSDDGVVIPMYVDYVNLVYRLASTAFIVGMGSLVFQQSSRPDHCIMYCQLDGG